MTGKTAAAVTRWARRNPGVGKMMGDIWVFTDEDVKKIGNLKRGPKPGKSKRKPKPPQAQPQEPTP